MHSRGLGLAMEVLALVVGIETAIMFALGLLAQGALVAPWAWLLDAALLGVVSGPLVLWRVRAARRSWGAGERPTPAGCVRASRQARLAAGEGGVVLIAPEVRRTVLRDGASGRVAPGNNWMELPGLADRGRGLDRKRG